MVSKRAYHHKNLRQKGQSLVEFALVLPLLLVLIITAIELGRLFYTQIVITNAAREGAYYLATHFEDPKAATNATDGAEAEAANSGIPAVNVGFDPASGWQPDEKVTVTVDTTVTDVLIVGFLGNIFSITSSNNSFDLSASVEMMVQP